MTDTKTYGFPNEWRGEIKAGEPIHDMWLRLTIDDNLLIHDIEVGTAASPFEICGAITRELRGDEGPAHRHGLEQAGEGAFGGPSGCTHQTEMLVRHRHGRLSDRLRGAEEVG